MTLWICLRSAKYRSGNLDFTPTLEGASNSRPVIAQLAANDPATAAEAVSILQASGVDGIDLNLGCPQAFAKRANFGAFLLPQQERVHGILTAMVAASAIPISAKIRIQPDLGKTLEIVKMIESTGISLLTVHGRTVKENKTTVAAPSFDTIAAIVRAVSIPVIANGGLEHPEDIQHVLTATGAAGVMSSEALLENPSFFSPTQGAHALSTGVGGDAHLMKAVVSVIPRQLSLAAEYLALAGTHYPISYGGSGGMTCVTSHIFKILYRVLGLEMFHAHRARLADKKQNRTVSDVAELVDEVSALFEMQQQEIFERRDIVSTSWYRRHRKSTGENIHGGRPLPLNSLDRNVEIRVRLEELKARRKERRRFEDFQQS